MGADECMVLISYGITVAEPTGSVLSGGISVTA